MTLLTTTLHLLTLSLVARSNAEETQNPFPASYPTLTGVRRFLSGPSTTSIDMVNRMVSRTSLKGLESIGGRVESDSNGARWVVGGHSYSVDEGEEEVSRNPSDSASAGGGGRWEGEATMEGPHHAFKEPEVGEIGADKEMEGRVKEVIDVRKKPPTFGIDQDWSKDWQYKEEDWRLVKRPNPSLDLPSLQRAADVLVAASNSTVEVSRNVSGLSNVSLHYAFYMSDHQDEDSKPELKVYHVVDGMKTLLQEEMEAGDWYSRILHIPQADNSMIIFEALRKDAQNVVALSKARIASKPQNQEPVDTEDTTTIITTTTPAKNTTTTQDNTTVTDISTPAREDTVPNTTQDEAQISNTTSPVEEDSTPMNTTAEGMPEEPEGEDIGTAFGTDETTKTKAAFQSSTITYFSPTQETAETNTEPSDFETTDNPDSESNPLDTGLDSTDDGNTDSNSTDMGENTAASATDAPDVYLDADEGESTTIDTFSSTEESVTNPDGDPMRAVDPSGQGPNQTDPSMNTQPASLGQNTTSLEPLPPQTNGTLENITATSNPEFLLPSGGNSTEEAVKVEGTSSTSWQVFQVFIVLCVLGFLALGFVYLKRKRRQDDEIPVFTRHTDYQNPTFSMEDATNFMSRVGRNSYKTID